MAEKKPIIRLNVVKVKEAGYKLLNNEEEWKKFLEEDLKNLEETGGKHILAADCFWSDGECAVFTISEWPDIESYQKHAKYEIEHEWSRYFDLKFYLGTRSELR